MPSPLRGAQHQRVRNSEQRGGRKQQDGCAPYEGSRLRTQPPPSVSHRAQQPETCHSREPPPVELPQAPRTRVVPRHPDHDTMAVLLLDQRLQVGADRLLQVRHHLGQRGGRGRGVLTSTIRQRWQRGCGAVGRTGFRDGMVVERGGGSRAHARLTHLPVRRPVAKGCSYSASCESRYGRGIQCLHSKFVESM